MTSTVALAYSEFDGYQSPRSDALAQWTEEVQHV